jgi:acetyl esterase
MPTATMRYNGMHHDFGLLSGVAEVPAVRLLFVHNAAGLKKYLV